MMSLLERYPGNRDITGTEKKERNGHKNKGKEEARKRKWEKETGVKVRVEGRVIFWIVECRQKG